MPGQAVALRDGHSAKDAASQAETTADPRSFLLGYARAAVVEGFDREAISALQELRRQYNRDPADAAIWQLVVVQLATRIGEHRQVVAQLQKLDGDLDDLQLHRHPRSLELDRLAIRFLRYHVSTRYIGHGCTRSGMNFFEPDNDQPVQMLLKLARRAEDGEAVAASLFTLGEIWVYHDAKKSAKYYQQVIAAEPSSKWAEKARACLVPTSSCGGLGASDLNGKPIGHRELTEWILP